MRTTSVIAGLAALLAGATYAERGAGATTPQQEHPGKAAYEENCRKCHGVRGIPPKTMKAKYSKIATFDEPFFEKRSDDSVVTVLMKGKNEDMKSFKEKMTREQMVAVAAYIRTLGTKEKD
jgi:mono/diheme cytochrome c family protein